MNSKSKLWLLLLVLPLSWALSGQENFVLENKTAHCTLILKDGKLSGKCINSFFTDLEINLTNPKLDSVSLFKQLPLNGKALVNYVPNSGEKVEYELQAQYAFTTRAGFPQILLKTTDGWFAMDHLKIYRDSITFQMDNDPDPPITQSDLLIIRKTKELLKNESQWNRNDDRKCRDDDANRKYSLFCALQKASVEITGSYDHRKAVMQKIRKTIVEIYPDKVMEHRLLDFNNMPETDHNRLINLLTRVEHQIVKELEEQ